MNFEPWKEIFVGVTIRIIDTGAPKNDFLSSNGRSIVDLIQINVSLETCSENADTLVRYRATKRFVEEDGSQELRAQESSFIGTRFIAILVSRIELVVQANIKIRWPPFADFFP